MSGRFSMALVALVQTRGGAEGSWEGTSDWWAFAMRWLTKAS